MPDPASGATLGARYQAVRELTERLAAPLSAEDQTVQSMPDTSPTKWHRAHTTWFFETFILERFDPEHEPVNPAYRVLFNSYYQGVGDQFPRPQRGVITRPGIDDVAAYRAEVDRRVEKLVAAGPPSDELADLLILGLHHEQQHQELLLMDIKHVLAQNPTEPAYLAPVGTEADPPRNSPAADGARRWIDIQGGVVEIGIDAVPAGTTADRGFAFDNESPRHRAILEPYAIADRLVTAGEWKAFIADGGYRRPDLWLSDGWNAVQTQGWDSPLYWRRDACSSGTVAGDGWRVHTLAGTRPVRDDEPVCHVSFYEADAFARWAGARLPTEVEWEHAVVTIPSKDRTFDLTELHPLPAGTAAATPGPGGERAGGPARLHQVTGECWQWTASAYLPYPGFVTAPGAVGEYNGKFMSGQMVLRGSCALTPPGHARPTYRNFFPPAARWPMTGVRLATGGTPS